MLEAHREGEERIADYAAAPEPWASTVLRHDVTVYDMEFFELLLKLESSGWTHMVN